MSEALERSERELRAASVLLEQELFDEVLPLAYQAAEDAARVALEANGLESAKTHAATIARFGELLMSKGTETEAGRALNRLAQRRQQVVYDWLPATADDARDAVAWGQTDRCGGAIPHPSAVGENQVCARGLKRVEYREPTKDVEIR